MGRMGSRDMARMGVADCFLLLSFVCGNSIVRYGQNGVRHMGEMPFEKSSSQQATAHVGIVSVHSCRASSDERRCTAGWR